MQKDEPLKPVINYDSFTLSFVRQCDVNKDSEEDDESEDSRFDQLVAMQDQIPKECIFLGELNNEIDHSPGLSWAIEEYYYLMPWSSPEYDWALFRISWDDNWGRFEWTTDARIKGVTEPKKAARLMFQGLMDKWGYDLSDEDYEPYSDLFESL
jgi:hypothetical protein